MREKRSDAARRLEVLRAASPGGAPPPASRAEDRWVSAPDAGVPSWPVAEAEGDADDDDLPLLSRRARSVRPAAGAAAAALAVVVAVVAWMHVAGAGQAVELAPRSSLGRSASAGAAGRGQPPGTTAPVVPGAATPLATITGVVVDVEGRVRRPGLQRLPPGARVADAVRAAGGTTAGALVAGLNLARVLTDGEQVLVPGPGDPGQGSGSSGGVSPGGAPVGGSSGGAASAGPVDLNTATQDGLDALPGVGPVLAARIVAWRAQHGRFSSVDELAEVPGIGPKALERLRPLVRV